MHLLTVILLATVQGIAELLPVSSSAHVILIEKLLGLDPSAPDMTFLLVMLHSGTMLAVLVYFWNRWKQRLSKSNSQRKVFVWMLVVGTAVTGVVGLGLQWEIEKLILGGGEHAAVENLFGNTLLIGMALAAVGVLILISGSLERKTVKRTAATSLIASSLIVGLVQGFSLPFRGLSRSGSTISTALLRGIPRDMAEEFSFFLAVILTLPVVGREALRLKAIAPAAGTTPWLMGGCGLLFSFAAGLFAIRWLSSWLERGRWGWFGFYCLALAALIVALRCTGILD